jgi:tRNA (guanine-N7-)-methyltransferase
MEQEEAMEQQASGAMKRPASEVTAGSSSSSSSGEPFELPAPKFFKVRAHANPLSESLALQVPARPSDMDWAATLYPRWLAAPVPSGRRVEWVDIGCGFGGLVASLAQQFPEETILGMEIRDKVSIAAMDRIHQLRARAAATATAAGLPTFENVAVLRSNCMRSLQQFFFKGQLTKLCFCFPDPHFQAHTHRRRVISRGLLATYAYVLREGGLLYTVTDVIDLHEWHVRHIEEHPLFERLRAEEETPEHDPVVAAITRRTDESVKVAKVQGDVFVAVFRRIADGAVGASGAAASPSSALQAARQSAAARILSGARASGRLLQSTAGVPTPISLADAQTIQAMVVRGSSAAGLGELVGWRAAESSLAQSLSTRLPTAPILSTGVAEVAAAEGQPSAVLSRHRQNITRLVPHVALRLGSGGLPALAANSADAERGLWAAVEGVGVVLEAVGARHTCELDDQSSEALYWQRVADGGGSVTVALGEFSQGRTVSATEQEQGTFYCEFERRCGDRTDVVRSAVTCGAVAASILALARSVGEAALPLGSLLLVPAGKGAHEFEAGDTITARLSGAALGTLVSAASIALEGSEVVAVTRRHAYAREVRPKIVQGVNMRTRDDIPAALGGSDRSTPSAGAGASAGGGGAAGAGGGNAGGAGLSMEEDERTGDGSDASAGDDGSSANLAVLLGCEAGQDAAAMVAQAVAGVLQRRLQDQAPHMALDGSLASMGVQVVGRGSDHGSSSYQPVAAVCEVVGLRVPPVLLTSGGGGGGKADCSLSLGGLLVHPIPDIYHGSRQQPKQQSSNELAAACRQQISEATRAAEIFSVYGCDVEGEGFDPVGECLREEYEYLLPVSCLQRRPRRAARNGSGGARETVSMRAQQWQLNGAGVLSSDADAPKPAAAGVSGDDSSATVSSSASCGLLWTLPQLGNGPGGGTALISTKLPASSTHVGGGEIAGGSLEWCVSRGAVCDVRVRLAIRQAQQPPGEWWVSGEASFPCALVEEAGQYEVKSQALFSETDTWQVLRTDSASSQSAGDDDEKSSTSGSGGNGSNTKRKRQRGYKGKQKKGQLRPQGRATSLTAEWGAVVEVGWLLDGEAPGASLALKRLRVVTGGKAAATGGEGPPQGGLALLPRLTSLLRCFDGSPRLHNYTGGGARPADRSTHAHGVRCRNHGLLLLEGEKAAAAGHEDEGEEFIVLSLAAPRFQIGQLCRIVGAIAALLSAGCHPNDEDDDETDRGPATATAMDLASANGEGSAAVVGEGEISFVEATLRPECVLPWLSSACAPSELLYLTERKFKRWGGNRARRMGQAPAVARAIVAWRASLQQNLGASCRAAGSEQLWAPWHAARGQILGALTELLPVQAAAAAAAAAATTAHGATEKSSASWQQPLPAGWAAPEFTAVLSRLRAMTTQGAWPATPASRAHIFLPRAEAQQQPDTAAAAGGISPPPSSVTLTAETAAGLGLGALWEEALRLEAALAPEGRRLPSSSVTVNSHAQFRPHTDHLATTGPAGVEASQSAAATETETETETDAEPQPRGSSPQPPPQSLSDDASQRTLMVGLGSYCGGELLVEGVEHDIRYAPLSYDGVTQKHWTAAFQGERYTLVWA